jgi:hypothetical protein
MKRMMDDDDEVMGEPVFELLTRDGKPIVAGSYFMHPPLRQRDIRMDDAVPNRVIVTSTDGREWYTDDMPPTGKATLLLQPLPSEQT